MIDLKKLFQHRAEEGVRPRTLKEKIAYFLRLLRKK